MRDEPTRQLVLDLLQDLHDRALEAESFAPALKALEMIGREIGMWRDEARHGAKHGATLAELILGEASGSDDGAP